MNVSHMARCNKHQAVDAWRTFCCPHSQAAYVREHRDSCGFDSVETNTKYFHD